MPDLSLVMVVSLSDLISLFQPVVHLDSVVKSMDLVKTYGGINHLIARDGPYIRLNIMSIMRLDTGYPASTRPSPASKFNIYRIFGQYKARMVLKFNIRLNIRSIMRLDTRNPASIRLDWLDIDQLESNVLKALLNPDSWRCSA